MNDDTYWYVIGPSLKDKRWKKANKKTNGHIIPLGYINYNDRYSDYLQAADLYIDSYPIHGFTAAIDAVSANTPVTCLESAFKMLKYLRNTRGYCLNSDSLISISKKVLYDKNFAQELLKEQQDSLEAEQSKTAWDNRINKLYEVIPHSHSVKNLKGEVDYNTIDDKCVVVNVMLNKRFQERFSLAVLVYKLRYLFYKFIVKNKLKEIKMLSKIS